MVWGVDRKYLVDENGNERYILAAEREALLAFTFQDADRKSIWYSYGSVERLLHEAQANGADISRHEKRLFQYGVMFTFAIRRAINVALKVQKNYPSGSSNFPKEIDSLVDKAVSSRIDISDFEEQILNSKIEYYIIKIGNKTEDLKDPSEYYYDCNFHKGVQKVDDIIVDATKLNMNKEQQTRFTDVVSKFMNVCQERYTKINKQSKERELKELKSKAKRK